MKKILFLLVISLFTLQSCSINSEIVYHKDSASTTMIDIDMKEAMSMMKPMLSDSLNKDKKGLGELAKIPKTWTSMYEIGKKEGKVKSNNPDSIRIMKKIFLKSNFDNNKMTGFSMKVDHFTKDDYKTVGNISQGQQLPIDKLTIKDWDGKTLTIDTEKLDLNSIKDLIANKIPSDQIAGMSPETLKMMYKSIGTTLKFEKKIKSISGKHDWITKTDDYSVKINYDLDYLFDQNKKPLTFNDKKVIIVTE